MTPPTITINNDGDLGNTDPGWEDRFYPCELWNGTTSYLYIGIILDVPGLTDQPDLASYTTPDQAANAASLVLLNEPLAAGFAAVFVQSFFWENAFQPASFLDINIDVDANIAAANLALGTAITAPTPSLIILCLREGVERFMITDVNNPADSAKAQSEIWLMDDWVSIDIGQEFNHAPGGSNVLYLDGHVEFIKYPEKWPVNTQMAILQGEEFGPALGR